MKYSSFKTFFTSRSAVLLLVFFAFWAGCHRGVNEQPQSSSQASAPKSAKPSFFRFAVVDYTSADVYAQPTAKSERLTQCVYGDVVRVEEETDWWYSVKVGPHPALSGWMHKAFVTPLSAEALYLKERNITTIVIRQKQSEVFIWPSQTFPIAMGTELPFLGESGQWYLVRLPNNDVGRIAKQAVRPNSSGKQAPLIHVKLQPEVPEAPSAPLLEPSQEQELLALLPQDVLAQRENIISTAEQFLGKVYVWGGTTPRGFDCSGLTFFVYKLNGIELPRVSWLQYRNKFGTKVQRNKLIQGDLVFFQTYKPGPSHVGIYIGNNQFIHASPKYGVTISDLDQPYFRKRYVGAKTVFSSSS